MKSILGTSLAAVVLVLIGAAAGYFATGVDNKPPDDAAAGAQAVQFESRTLQNLGVEVGEMKVSSFVAYREVQAVVRDAPLNRRPVAAPLPGIVKSIARRPGDVVASGGVLLRVVRDAIPRPELRLTAEMFRPVNENLHGAFADLRTAVGSLAIAEQELARLQKLNDASPKDGPPLISRQKMIDLGYARDRAKQGLANARSELEHHGLRDAEIDALAKGGHPPHNHSLWRRVLEVHGLWTAAVAQVHAALPEDIRDLPWTIALLGELAASGRVGPALVAAVAEESSIRAAFHDAGALLLHGHTVPRLRWIAERGALASVYDLRAPADRDDWDVGEVPVRPGQPIHAGDPVAVLHDPREMWLRVEPVGDEVPVLLQAMAKQAALTAVPLLSGAGPELDGLRIARMTTAADGTGDVAYAVVANQALEVEGSSSRSWRLRAGIRYRVRIPSQEFDNVYVFPKDGVAKEGVNRVVFVQDGKSFRSNTVRVVFEDEDHVLVANDGALFPGDVVVKKGAFMIAVAMQQGDGGGHHGHSH